MKQKICKSKVLFSVIFGLIFCAIIVTLLCPKLSNQFVKENLGCDSLVKYKRQLKRKILHIKNELEMEDIKNELVNLVVENSQIYEELNERIEKQYQELKKSYEAYAEVSGISYEDVLRQYDTSDKKMREHAENVVKQDVVIDAIIKNVLE